MLITSWSMMQRNSRQLLQCSNPPTVSIITTARHCVCRKALGFVAMLFTRLLIFYTAQRSLTKCLREVRRRLHPPIQHFLPHLSFLVHCVSGWTRGLQVKLWDPLRTRAIPERLTGVITTKRNTNPRLPYLTFTILRGSKSAKFGHDFLTHNTRLSLSAALV